MEQGRGQKAGKGGEKRRDVPSHYRPLLYDHERAGVPSEPPSTTRNAYHARGRLWGRERQCHVPATKRSMIESRSTSGSPIRIRRSKTGLGNRVRVPLRSATASVVENPQREREKGRERKQEEDGGGGVEKERQYRSNGGPESRWVFSLGRRATATCHCPYWQCSGSKSEIK